MTADRVVLLRHGRTASNAAGIWQGQLDIPLDEVGIGEAGRAAELLATLPPARIVASDLSRAAATASAVAVASGLEVETDVAFRELDAGLWQGRSGTEIQQRWPQDHQAWRAGHDVRLGGGESRSEAAVRVADALQKHVAATGAGVLLVVGHGGSLRSGILRLLGVPDGQGGWLGRLRNAHWAVLVPGVDGWVLQSWNASAPEPVRDAVRGQDRGVD